MDGKLWTAEELEKLSPEERIEIVRAGIVTNVDQVPPAFLERVQENARDHIACSESAVSTDLADCWQLGIGRQGPG